MYSEFKRFAADSSLPRMERTRGLLENMLEYAGYYAAIKGIASAGSGDANVDRRLASIQTLNSTVTDPMLLYMFAAWKHERITRDGCGACSRISNRICSAEWSARYPATD